MSEKELPGKVAIVTGASSGIGEATALRFARAGAKLVLVARSEKALQSLAAKLAEQGTESLGVVGDLSVPTFAPQVAERALQAFGGIDCLVNAAGAIAAGSIKDTSLKDWNALMDLNLTAVFALMQACVPGLIASKGSIVNVSSLTGLRSFPGRLGYCVSKAAVDQLTRCAALELAPDGVRVNAVNPAVVVTNLQLNSGMSEAEYAAWLANCTPAHPLGRVGKVEEVAELILFLASDKAGWITGITCPIDGGRAQASQ
jgi:NAD(P)-dependent dehydrogenase (short-subunit alcohol dehydrogenase family)